MHYDCQDQMNFDNKEQRVCCKESHTPWFGNPTTKSSIFKFNFAARETYKSQPLKESRQRGLHNREFYFLDLEDKIQRILIPPYTQT